MYFGSSLVLAEAPKWRFKPLKFIIFTYSREGQVEKEEGREREVEIRAWKCVWKEWAKPDEWLSLALIYRGCQIVHLYQAEAAYEPVLSQLTSDPSKPNIIELPWSYPMNQRTKPDEYPKATLETGRLSYDIIASLQACVVCVVGLAGGHFHWTSAVFARYDVMWCDVISLLASILLSRSRSRFLESLAKIKIVSQAGRSKWEREQSYCIGPNGWEIE